MEIVALYQHPLDEVLNVVEINTSGYTPASKLCKIVVLKPGINKQTKLCTYTNIPLDKIIK